MKRLVSVAVAAASLTLAAPGVALAHHHHHHKAKHHARRARLVRFGSFTGAGVPGPSTGTQGRPTPPSPPSTPTPPPVEPAGKVLTFENGVLTIELTGGTQVSGKVDETTRLICLSATPPPPPTGGPGDDQGGGDDRMASISDEHGGPSQAGEGWQGEDGQQSGGSDDNDADEQPPVSCTTANLTAGAPVRAAELRFTSAGAVWEVVVLAPPPSA